jgi:hypothetical protein
VSDQRNSLGTRGNADAAVAGCGASEEMYGGQAVGGSDLYKDRYNNNGKRSMQDASGQKEIGGRDGPDPTRFGDWEIKGRCIDF